MENSASLAGKGDCLWWWDHRNRSGDGHHAKSSPSCLGMESETLTVLAIGETNGQWHKMLVGHKAEVILIDRHMDDVITTLESLGTRNHGGLSFETEKIIRTVLGAPLGEIQQRCIYAIAIV